MAIGIIKGYAQKSVVFFSYFKEASGMSAYGANAGSLLADYKVSAVAAFPDGLFALFKYLLHLNVVKKCAVSFLMSLWLR